MPQLVYLLALVWGAFWAIFLQSTSTGRWLVIKRTWITVVVGIGVDLLLLLLILSFDLWLQVLLVIGASSFPIIIRSLLREQAKDRELIELYDDHQDPAS